MNADLNVSHQRVCGYGVLREAATLFVWYPWK
jgi:hypothetical protein